MTIQPAKNVIIKVGDGESSESFSTIGGLVTTRLRVNNQVIEASDVASGQWRAALDGAGVSSVTLSGEGMFTDATSETLAQGYAMAASVDNYQLLFGNGNTLSGPFLIAQYERAGNYGDVETYALTLESAGVITVNAE